MPPAIAASDVPMTTVETAAVHMPVVQPSAGGSVSTHQPPMAPVGLKRRSTSVEVSVRQDMSPAAVKAAAAALRKANKKHRAQDRAQALGVVASAKRQDATRAEIAARVAAETAMEEVERSTTPPATAVVDFKPPPTPRKQKSRSRSPVNQPLNTASNRSSRDREKKDKNVNFTVTDPQQGSEKMSEDPPHN